MIPLKKQLEKLGTFYIAEQLYREGLRFAVPDIDDGVDLIVYDQGESRPFISVPVQLKAFSNEEFCSDRKYLRIDGLFIIYLWHVGRGGLVQAFGMKYREAEKIVDQQGWSRDKKGRYAVTQGSQNLREALKPFAVGSWRKLFFGEVLANPAGETVNAKVSIGAEAMDPYVISALAMDDYQLDLLFDNGERRVFDVKPYLSRGIFVRLQDRSIFQAAQVISGSVEWPGGLDLSYETLYIKSQPVVETPTKDNAYISEEIRNERSSDSFSTQDRGRQSPARHIERHKTR